MRKTLLFAGFGGQGILLLSKMIALAATEEGKEVTWWPNYEGGKRGGLTTTTLVISDSRILCPAASVGKTDLVLAMDNRTLHSYEAYLKPGGRLVINTSIVTDKPTRDDIEVLEIPANEIAESVNADRSLNMVVCAAMCKKYALADTEYVFRQIPVVCEGKEKFIPANERAFRIGLELF